MDEKIKEFRDGIFALRTRRLGVVAEYMIKYLYGYEFSHTINYDLIDTQLTENNLIEVKFSLCLKKHNEKITNKNIIQQCQNSKLDFLCLSSSDIRNNKFDCNIQQVKPELFSTLFYGIFFTDKIEIFKMTSEQVNEVLVKEEFSSSANQHFGNTGEGQFHINNKTYNKHKDDANGFFVRSLTYEELYNLFKLHEND